jgi:hypothetical protein
MSQNICDYFICTHALATTVDHVDWISQIVQIPRHLILQDRAGSTLALRELDQKVVILSKALERPLLHCGQLHGTDDEFMTMTFFLKYNAEGLSMDHRIVRTIHRGSWHILHIPSSCSNGLEVVSESRQGLKECHFLLLSNADVSYNDSTLRWPSTRDTVDRTAVWTVRRIEPRVEQVALDLPSLDQPDTSCLLFEVD